MGIIDRYMASNSSGTDKPPKQEVAGKTEELSNDVSLEDNFGIDINQIIKIVWFYRRFFAIIALGLATIFVFGNHYIFPDKYETVASVRVKSIGIDDPHQSSRRFEVLPGEILSNKVLEQVIEDLKLVERKNTSVIKSVLSSIGIASTSNDESTILRWLKRDVIVLQESTDEMHTDLFKIKLVDKDGKLAAEIVNDIADTYIKVKQDIIAQDNAETVQFLGEKIQFAEKRMKDAADELTDFQVNNANYLIPATSLDREIEMLHTEYRDNLIRIDQIKELRKRLRKSLNEEERYVTSFIGTGTPNSIDGELHMLKVELASLKGKYTDRHPLIISLQEKISETQSIINRTERTGISGLSKQSNPEYVSFKRELDTIEAEQIVLERRIPEIERRIEEINMKIVKTLSAQRTIRTIENKWETAHDDYRVLNDEYITYNLRAEANASDIGNDFSVLDYADIPILSSPSRHILMVLGVLLAYAISLVIVLIVSRFYNWKPPKNESKTTNPMAARLLNVFGVIWSGVIISYIIIVPYL